jgi:uncharacterized membrane protein YtjA (UPF0391 family)
MLSWTLTFLVVATIAGVLGFGGLAGTAAWLAHTYFVIFIVFVLDRTSYRPTCDKLDFRGIPSRVRVAI